MSAVGRYSEDERLFIIQPSELGYQKASSGSVLEERSMGKIKKRNYDSGSPWSRYWISGTHCLGGLHSVDWGSTLATCHFEQLIWCTLLEYFQLLSLLYVRKMDTATAHKYNYFQIRLFQIEKMRKQWYLFPPNLSTAVFIFTHSTQIIFSYSSSFKHLLDTGCVLELLPSRERLTCKQVDAAALHVPLLPLTLPGTELLSHQALNIWGWAIFVGAMAMEPVHFNVLNPQWGFADTSLQHRHTALQRKAIIVKYT